MDDFENRYDDAEMIALFDKLFPKGFAGPDVLRDIAPGGWAASPLVALFHPSPEQRLEEAVRIHENLGSLRKPKEEPDEEPETPPPTMEEILAEGPGDPIAAEEEVCRVVGLCLWDIFSDSHDVVDADGRDISLGSFRASGGFLADRLNAQVKAGVVKGPAIDAMQRIAEVEEQMKKHLPKGSSSLLFQFMRDHQTGPYDYMDFYMGSGMIGGRADLTPVYRMIFTRLKALDLDWHYHFPRLQVVDMRPLGEALKAREKKDEPEWLNYSPEDAFEKEAENRERDEEIAETREMLDEGYRESVAAALEQPPPLTVRVYEAVFGTFPNGWPPTPETD